MFYFWLFIYNSSFKTLQIMWLYKQAFLENFLCFLCIGTQIEWLHAFWPETMRQNVCDLMGNQHKPSCWVRLKISLTDAVHHPSRRPWNTSTNTVFSWSHVYNYLKRGWISILINKCTNKHTQLTNVRYMAEHSCCVRFRNGHYQTKLIWSYQHISWAIDF